MCGIAGVAVFGEGRLPEQSTLDDMLDTLHHRGPDASDWHIANGVALGACRLAIIDLANGQQPLLSEDGAICVTHNGEIYNFMTLRRELEARGYRFRTDTDGEVLIHGYREWGEGVVERLNGMFSFALHARRKGKLLLARDRAGIKPLYFARVGDQLLWGSEPKAILANPLVPRNLNHEATLEFLAWEYVPGNRTLFEEIRKLTPGSYLSFDLNTGTCTECCYWTPPLEYHNFSNEEWLERLDGALKNSVKRHLMSDVPLGTFLSGGVDSSLLLSYAPDVPAFHVSFQESSYNETKYAERVVQHLGSELHTRTLDSDLLDDFSLLLETMDDPIADSSLFSTYLLCRSTREHVKVALSGDGGDELFGGYDTYQAERVARLYNLLPASLRTGIIEPLSESLKPRAVKKGLINRIKRFVEGTREPNQLQHTRWRLFMGRDLARGLLSAPLQESLDGTVEQHIDELFNQARNRDGINKMLWVDFRSYLSENCLAKVDKASMLCSLEARVPMLDNEILELAFAMPGSLKIAFFQQKVILKRLAARRLPKECVYRPKEGFSVPLKHFLCTSLRPLLEDSTSKERLSSIGLLDPQIVQKLKREHLEGRANHSHVLWSIIILDQFHRRWL